MTATRVSNADWLTIEGLVRAGQRSIRSIASEFDVSESLIRKKAKRAGWARDPSGVVRERVAAAMAGAGAQEDARGAHCAQQAMAAAATSAIDDMNLGLSNAQLALQRVSEMLPKVDEPRDVKTLSETNKLNIEVIRTIRGLDDQKGSGSEERLTKAERDAIVAAAMGSVDD